MPAPKTAAEFLDLVRRSGLLEDKRLDAYLDRLRAAGGLPEDPRTLAGCTVRDAVLTKFQAEQLLLGRWRRFSIGKYKVLERLGAGGMGSVYLCEHKFMRRRTAVKVLPTAKAVDPECLERFYREARAAAALDHPNIVRAYDIDQEDNLHFMVMEYIDGSSLQDIVKHHGPMDCVRAAHYIAQAARGLQHAHEAAGLVHRDIKPGNILVDRQGGVKVLDMGLARFFDEEDVLTEKRDDTVLGTADYLAPEQVVDSHNVDIRADIYSLGATFYFLLTGNTPFTEGTVAEKLIWHQLREPTPVRELRPEVPPELAAVVQKMMAKDVTRRYQTPAEVAAALEPWTREPIPPPPEQEMPRLSPAAMVGSGAAAENGAGGQTPLLSSSGSSVWRRPPLSSYPGRPSAPSLAEAPTKKSLREPTTSPQLSLPSVPLGPPSPSPVPAPIIGKSAGWSRRRLIAAAVAGLVLLAGVIVVFYWALAGRAHPPGTAGSTGSILPVSHGDVPGAFRTISEALARARPGDRIVVQEPTIEERLVLDGDSHVTGVTIEGGAADGRVVWRCPPQPKEQKFLMLSGAKGLHLRGFALDGRGQVADLVVVTGQSPGLLLEDMELRGFRHAGVVLRDCMGLRQPEGEVELKGLRVVADLPADCALNFSSGTPSSGGNGYVTVTDCRLEGPYQGAVRIAGALADARFRRNRIFRSTDGLVYEKTALREPLELSLDSNTFCEIEQAGLHFAALPLDGLKSRVDVRRNLFAKTTILAGSDEPLDSLPKKMIFGSPLGNICDLASREGNIPLLASGMGFVLGTDATLDASFLRCDRSSPLNHTGPDATPVGVPPR